MRDRIEQVVDEIIRPLVEADGGEVELQLDETPEVTITLRGACVGCPGVHFTRRHVIEPALRRVTGPDARIEVTNTARAPVSRSRPGSSR